MKRWMYERRLKQALAGRKEERKPSTNMASKVGVLYLDDGDGEAEKFIRKLTQKGRHVQRLIVSDIKIKKGEEAPADTLTANGINWYGWPTDPIVEGFVYEPFDVLICLALDSHPLLQHIMRLSRAHFKIAAAAYTAEADLAIDLGTSPSLSALSQGIVSTLSSLQPPKA